MVTILKTLKCAVLHILIMSLITKARCVLGLFPSLTQALYSCSQFLDQSMIVGALHYLLKSKIIGLEK